MIHITVFVITLAMFDASALIKHRPFYPTENYYEDFFEGDILLRNGTFAKDRSATTHQMLKWPNGVVIYNMDEIYSQSEKELVRSAMDEFEKESCIKWVERTDEDYYVDIHSEVGCWSALGRVGEVQSLSLETPICMDKGIIMHEMMHTLGFMHEHSRHDRDDYIRVIWSNIDKGMQHHFEKQSPLELDDLGFDYDYRSVMHYRSWMFAEDRSHPTLKPIDGGISLEDLGDAQSKGVFTDIDIQKINKFYECSAK